MVMPGSRHSLDDSPRSPNQRHTTVTSQPRSAYSAMAPPARQTKSAECALTTSAVFFSSLAVTVYSRKFLAFEIFAGPMPNPPFGNCPPAPGLASPKPLSWQRETYIISAPRVIFELWRPYYSDPIERQGPCSISTMTLKFRCCVGSCGRQGKIRNAPSYPETRFIDGFDTT